MSRLKPLKVADIAELRPKERRYTATDGKGLGLDVETSGSKSWRYRYRLAGRPGIITLGRFPAMSIDNARKKRDEVAAAVAKGESPADLKRRAKIGKLKRSTVKDFGERYLREIVAEDRQSPADVRRYLERDVYPALGHLPLASIHADHVREIVFARKATGHRSAALAIRNVIKRMCDYAIVCGVIESNPAHAIPPKYIAEQVKRDRALSEAEIGEFLRALDAASIAKRYKIALELILLTLVRKSALCLALWSEFDFKRSEWAIPKEHDKMGQGQIVYLSRQATALIGQLHAPGVQPVHCVLPSLNSRWCPISKSTLNKQLARVPVRIPHFTIHDLRRTATTRLSEMGWEEKWIEKCLNHKTAGVKRIYNRAEYAEDRRLMLQAWADRVDSLRGLPNVRQI
jgi:integrase